MYVGGGGTYVGGGTYTSGGCGPPVNVLTGVSPAGPTKNFQREVLAAPL